MRARLVGLYPNSNEKRVELFANWRLYEWTFNQLRNKFFPRTCWAKYGKHDRRELVLFKEEFRLTEMICLCSKTNCCYDSQSNKFKFSSKESNKRTLEGNGDGPMSKYRTVLDGVINVTSTDTGFRSIQHAVATYEQTKKWLSYFFPNEMFSKVDSTLVPFSYIYIQFIEMF